MAWTPLRHGKYTNFPIFALYLQPVLPAFSDSHPVVILSPPVVILSPPVVILSEAKDLYMNLKQKRIWNRTL